MMTKDEKKELFLHLIKTWFEDTTYEINNDNCIGFYHYFLDCLSFEAKFGPAPEPEIHRFIGVFLDFLHNFPDYKTYILSGSNSLKIMALKHDINLSDSQFKACLEYIKILFFNIKDEYFL